MSSSFCRQDQEEEDQGFALQGDEGEKRWREEKVTPEEREADRERIQKLFLVMISEAVQSLLKRKRGRRRKEAESQEQKEAREWLMSDEITCDEHNGISFRFICSVLKIDHRWIRKKINEDPSQVIAMIGNWRRSFGSPKTPPFSRDPKKGNIPP